jgi:hypothetical protein
MRRSTRAILAAVALAVPLIATSQAHAASCIASGTGKSVHSAAYYECLGHSPRAAKLLATQDASEDGRGN